MSARLTPAFVTGLGSVRVVRSVGPPTRFPSGGSLGGLGATIGTVTRPGASRFTDELITDVSPFDARAGLEWDRLRVSLNGGGWSCTLGDGTVIVACAYQERYFDWQVLLPQERWRLAVWYRRRLWDDWQPATDSLAEALAGLLPFDPLGPDPVLDILAPALATDPSESTCFGLVVAARPRGEADSDRILYARLRVESDSDEGHFAFLLTDSASVTPLVARAQAPSLSFSPDGLPAFVYHGVDLRRPTADGPWEVALHWDDGSGSFDGELLVDDPTVDAQFPSVAQGPDDIVVVYRQGPTGTAPPSDYSVLAWRAPRSASASVNPSGASVRTVAVAGAELGGDACWDPCVAWIEEGTFVVVCQADDRGSVRVLAIASSDGGVTWPDPAEQIDAGTPGFDYFPSACAVDRRVVCAWEERDARFAAATACQVGAVTAGWDGGLDTPTTVADVGSPAFAFSVFPTVSANESWWTCAWVAYSVVTGAETDVALRARHYEV